MKIAMDVAYHGNNAVVGLVRFKGWNSSQPLSLNTIFCTAGHRYIPGEFYRRELPCLIKALESVKLDYSHVLIDGYVHLQEPQVKGLGYHVYEYLAGRAVVIGVAKSPLKVARDYVPVLRGRSRKPLFVSAIGMDSIAASVIIAGMHGKYRLPTMLKHADSLAKGVYGQSC
ncbi:MAG: endonuclease V [Desulfobulbales bacterium]